MTGSFVGLNIHPAPSTDGDDDDALRWQILTVVDGKVKDIRGYDERDEAVSRLG